MDEFVHRQLAQLRSAASSHASGKMSLAKLIPRIEGIGEILGASWKEQVFPLLLSMEQINAASVNERRALTAAELESVRNSLAQLEKLIADLEGG